MTLKDLYGSVSKKTGLKQKDVEAVYDAVIETIVEEMNSSKEIKVSVPKMGTITVVEKAEHMGRNPRTGEMKPVPAKRRASFKFLQSFKDRLN